MPKLLDLLDLVRIHYFVSIEINNYVYLKSHNTEVKRNSDHNASCYVSKEI